MASELLSPTARVLDANGNPYSGATWTFYASGTSTPQNVYSNSTLATSLGSTVTADSGGKFVPIYFDSTLSYRGVCKDSTGAVTLHDIDPINTGSLAALAASSGSSLLGFIASGSGAVARTAQSKMRDYISVKDFGATGDGTTNDRAAIALADATGNVTFPAGAYKVSSSLTISSPVVMMPGATLVIPTGVTVTIAGTFSAPVASLFVCTGTGAVAFTQQPKVGHAEWWGAISGSSAGSIPANNVTAFNAALLACQNVEMLQADYYINSTVKHYQPNGRLAGVGSIYDSTYGTRTTRLIGTTSTMNVLQVGPDSNPGTINQFPRGLKVSGLQVQRAVAPDIATSASAILVQFVLEALFEDVRGDESIQGWTFNGTVSTRVRNCSAKRTTAGTGGTDLWRGFNIVGSSGIASGGNASLYLDHCHADDTRSVRTAGIGFYAYSKFSDLFLTHCETVTCDVGIEINGDASATNNFGNVDCTIIHPIIDTCGTYGLYVHNLGLSGSVEVVSPYCGPASGASSAIQISGNKGGAISVIGGQLVMGVAATCKAITIDAAGTVSGAVNVDGTIILEAGDVAVAMSNATNCRMAPIIVNDSTTNSGAAIQLLNTCTANVIAPIVKGKASGSAYGIQCVGTADARNEYNCSGIDSGTIAGGSGNKMVRNGVSITAVGASGSNYVTGVMS